MTIDKLQEAHHAVPFRPFTIRLADGRAYNIPHRDFLSYSPNGGRTVIVYGQGDSFSILDLLLVTDLVIHQTVPSNGQQA
jgi:hypothetical protein